MSATIQEVENFHSQSWNALDQPEKQELLDVALNLLNNQYSAKVATLPTFEGDPDDGHKWLTAHLWELAEGGEAGSQSGTGGSVSFNTVTGEATSSLSETRYGRMFRDAYLRDEQSIGIVRTF